MKKLQLFIGLLVFAVLLSSCQLGDFENATTTQGSDPEATTPNITTEATTPNGNVEATTPNTPPEVTTPEGSGEATTPEEGADVTTPEENDEACRHILFDTVVAPSCTQTGSTIHSCVLCGYSFSDSVTEKLDHQYGEWEIVYDATLTTNGKKAKTCTSCGKEEAEFYQHEWNVNANTDMLEFREDYDNCSVSLKYEYIDYTGEIRVPAVSPEGNIVQSVGSLGFDNSKASAVHLPDTIVKIGDRAFASCPNLTSITIPENVKEIGKNILADSPNVKTVYFDAIACSWYKPAWGEGSAIEHLVVGDNVEYIPGGLFKQYTSLKSVVCGKNLKQIQNNAFLEATNLTSVQFNEGLQTIGDYAFSQSGLTSFNLPSTLIKVGDFGMAYTPLNSDQLIIPASLQYFGSSAFASTGRVRELVFSAEEVLESSSMSAFAPFNGLTVEKITISNNVRVLGETLFSGIAGITEITVDMQGDTLPSGLFAGCSTLEKVVLGDSIKKLSSSVFAGCTNLKEVVGIEHITHLGASAFSGCTNITFFDFTSIEEWGRSAFNGSGLCEVILPEDMTVLPVGAFSGCEFLKTLTLPAGLTLISADAFYASGIETLVLPDTVTEIGMYAFRYCSNLTSIKLSASLTKVGASAFEQCTSIKSIEIPEGVTSLMSFESWSSLERIVIPASVTHIPDNCFILCRSLKEVVILASVTEIPYGMFTYCNSLESVVLPDTVISIGDSAFYECTSLQSIVIPDSCTSIGVSAFYNCQQLQSVTFGNSITDISSRAFAFCAMLTEVILPDTVLNIDDGAFSRCTSLKKVYLGSSVQHIGDAAFMECTALETVFLPKSLLNISPDPNDWQVFKDCNDPILYTDADKIPTAWATYFGASILKNYTYEQYLNEVYGEGEAEN